MIIRGTDNVEHKTLVTSTWDWTTPLRKGTAHNSMEIVLNGESVRMRESNARRKAVREETCCRSRKANG